MTTRSPALLANRRLYPALHFATGFFNAATLIPLLFVVPVLLYALISGKKREGGFQRRCTAFYYGGLVTGLAAVVPGTCSSQESRCEVRRRVFANLALYLREHP